MEDQDVNQDHVIIEMELLDDDQPFAERAAVAIFPRDGTKQHRITPERPVDVFDGPQVKKYTVLPLQSHRRGKRGGLHKRKSYEETPAEESRGDREITEEMRKFYQEREAPRREDRRAPVSTECKWQLIFGCLLAFIIIIVVLPLLFGGSGRENGNRNLTVSLPLDNLRNLLGKALRH